jgi:hypothetical protein
LNEAALRINSGDGSHDPAAANDRHLSTVAPLPQFSYTAPMNPPRLSPGSADALLFDLGRVVLDIDFQKAIACWAGHAGCGTGDILKRFVRADAYRDHEIGKLSDAAYFDSLRETLGIDISDAQFLEGWNAIFAGEMPDIAPLLARAAKRLPLYAFSNTNNAYVDIFRSFMPTCSAISAKCSCLPRSGCGSRTRRPMITWCRRSACRRSVSCSSTISPRTSKARVRAASPRYMSGRRMTSQGRWKRSGSRSFSLWH